MLTRIKIKNYKSLQEVDVYLNKLCVLFGPNAAGKSNFLDSLHLVSQIVSKRNLKEAFEAPYRGAPLESFAFPDKGVKGLLEQESAHLRFEIDVSLSKNVIESVNQQIVEMRRGVSTPEQYQKTSAKQSSLVRETSLRYCIEVEILTKSGILRVYDEYLAALNQRGEPTRARKPFIEKEGDKLVLRMERQSHPTYYETRMDHSLISQPLYPPHYPHVVALREELANWFFYYFEPRERMRAPNPVKEVRHIGLMGEDLAAFLNTLKSEEPMQFRAVEKSINMLIPSITGIDVHINEIGQVELYVRERETLIPATLVSEGTLRLIGLLALQGVKMPPTLIGFEEPENGVHPRRISLIAEFLKNKADRGDTQMIVTTHSPILPDMIPDEYLFVVKKEDRKTSIQPLSYEGSLFRRDKVNKELDDQDDVSKERMLLRGDFDA